jgi:hypothetical protein
MSKFIYCQRKEEGQDKCKKQFGHCKEYYAPLEMIHSLRDQLSKIESILEKCRTSAMQDGWQTSKHARKSRRWDFYAQEKMKLINELDKLGAL